MALNQELEWAQVGAISTGSGTVKDAFRGGHAEKTLLKQGTVLYKFNNDGSLTGYQGKISEWWQPYQALLHDAGWLQKLEMAKHFGISVREWGRVTSAVKENWNSLEHLLVITLGLDVYGWFGGYSQMARIDSGKDSKRNLNASGEARGSGVNLPGGGTQLYIPNLQPTYISNWRTESLKDQ